MRLLVFFLAQIGFPGVSAAADRTITLVADQWCPYTCGAHMENRGILVERATKALELANIRVEYLEMPWSRAIHEVRNGTYDGLVGTGRLETPDFHFPETPIATVRHQFYTLPTSNWTFQGLESLESVLLGVIQDYSYGQLYDSYIEPNHKDPERIVTLRGDDVLGRLIELLRLGRIDVLVAEEGVIGDFFGSRTQPNPLRPAGLASREDLYVAFSPRLPNGQTLAQTFGQRLQEVIQLELQMSD